MSLYHETASVLTSPTYSNSSLKSRIYGRKDLKSPPAQVYALAIETCKWSAVLKEVIENTGLLSTERKISPELSLLLVHDLLLVRRGIALPASHGLRVSIERHSGRLHSEFTKTRVRMRISTIEALKAHVEAGLVDGGGECEAMTYPRWIRVNTIKNSLEDQLESTFSGYELVTSVDAVRHKGSKKLYIDAHVPNLIAVPQDIDLSRSEAYKAGQIIFQDKASCFPAYLLDPLSMDGDLIDTCSAPGNKVTHLAAILVGHQGHRGESPQIIHAFEKDSSRAETLKNMIDVAGSQTWTTIHPGEDFLRTNPKSPIYKDVGALLLDPSCSGSGIVGRDIAPVLHLPSLKLTSLSRNGAKKANTSVLMLAQAQAKVERKRGLDGVPDVLVDDDGVMTAVDTQEEMKTRVAKLAAFQLDLLLHAFSFPAARKVTYSTCSIHAEENEMVVSKALASGIARSRGWRILKREEQIKGLKAWPVRGLSDCCNHDGELADACIRTNKGDSHGTMGFFVAGFVREQKLPDDVDSQLLRDERGYLVRNIMGVPMRKEVVLSEANARSEALESDKNEYPDGGDEWKGFEEDDPADRRTCTKHGINQTARIRVATKARKKRKT